MKSILVAEKAPFWLPVVSFLKDFMAFQYVFSFEPGITSHAVFIKNLWLLPGSLLDGGLGGMAINLGFAVVVGLVIRYWAMRSNRGKNKLPSKATGLS